MIKAELLKTIISLDLRKNNLIKLYLNKKYFNSFNINNSYIEENDGTYSLIGTIKLINYYFSSGFKVGEFLQFEITDNKNCRENILAEMIVKIEVVKQNKTRTTNPIIEKIKSECNKSSLKESKELLKQLNI